MSEKLGTSLEPLVRDGTLVLRGRGGDPHRPERSDDVLLRECLQVLFRRRWLILALVLLSAAGATVYNRTATPIYEASARLLIEPSSSRVVPFRPVVEEEQGNLEYYQTQYEMLRSRVLAQKALEELSAQSRVSATGVGPTSTDTESRVSAFLAAVGVSPVKGSRLVDVKFRSSDREFAAKAANAIVQAYIEDKRVARLRASREASAWLNERLTKLREQVDSTQGTLQQYRERNEAISLDDRQNIVVQKLAQLNSAVTDARTQRIAKQTVYEQLQALQQSGAPLDTFSPILSNGFIQNLKAELAGLQRERAQLAQQLGSLHPDMVRVETAIANAERRLNVEIGKVVAGIRNDFLSAQANERGLMGALETQKNEVLDMNKKGIQYNALQREASSTQQMFDNLLQRVKEADVAGELETSDARLLDAAIVPMWPILPRERLNLVVSVLVGFVLAIGLVLALEYLKPSLKTAEDIGHALGLPVLGITPRIRRFKGHAVNPATLGDLPPAFREALGAIRTRVLLSSSTSDLRALAVTSTTSGEGKTLIASNLAISMALTGRRVLLVDGDMRRPQLHRMFDLSRTPGLSDVITTDVGVSTAIRESSVQGLFVLPAGAPLASPSDLLDTDRFRFLIRELTGIFELVVLDCPPVMAVADAAIIANATAAGLFVIGAGLTSREMAQAAIDRLVAAQAQIVGVVLNKADSERHAQGSYSYYSDDQPPEALEPDVRQAIDAVTVD
jgi:polysaccharide biosynthesis transport protein